MEILFLLLFLSILTKFYSCAEIDWIDGYTSEDHPGLSIEYTFYRDEKSWNEAKFWCESVGGSLAKIDSRSVLDAIVHSFWDTYNQDVFKHDYWIGLTEVTEGQFRWSSDCSGLTWIDNYLDPWNDGKQCFRLKKGNHYGDRDDCEDANSFMCQRHRNQSCVMQKPSPVYHYETHYSNNESLCESRCYNDTYCIAGEFNGVDKCTILTRNGTENMFHFHVKNCVTVNWIETDVNPPSDESKTPYLNCGQAFLPSSSSTTSTSTTTTATTTSMTTTISTTTHSLATCTTPVYLNLSEAEILAIAREISKNLTIDVKKTSAYIRRLTSAEDTRSSSTAVGYVGIIFIITPLSILVLSDFIRVIFTFRRNINEIWKTWRFNNIVIVLQLQEPEDVFGQHCYV